MMQSYIYILVINCNDGHMDMCGHFYLVQNTRRLFCFACHTTNYTQSKFVNVDSTL